MAFLINSPGPTTILSSTAAAAGEWYRIHPKMGNLGITIEHTGSSVGATVQSTVYIQGSNDGVNPMLTTAGSTVDALATIVFNGGSPQKSGFSLNTNWGWIRAFTNALSTGTVRVRVTGGMRS